MMELHTYNHCKILTDMQLVISFLFSYLSPQTREIPTLNKSASLEDMTAITEGDATENPPLFPLQTHLFQS